MIRAGTTLCYEQGTYDWWERTRPVRALRDFDLTDVVESFIAATPRAKRGEANDLGEQCTDFRKWLVDQGYVAEMGIGIWRLGSSGFDPARRLSFHDYPHRDDDEDESSNEDGGEP